MQTADWESEAPMRRRRRARAAPLTALVAAAALLASAGPLAAPAGAGADSASGRDRPTGATVPDSPDIVGGTEVPTGERSYTGALLGFPGRDDPANTQFCGSALIAPQVLVTSAWCMTLIEGFGEPGPVAPPGDEVLLGQVELSADLTGQGQFREVDAVSRHPRFDGGTGLEPRFTNDLALLRLDAPVGGGLDPIAVAGPDDAALYEPGTSATALGWGDMSNREDDFADSLRQAVLNIATDADCDDAYSIDVPADTTVCAGGFGPGTCVLDGGGPLVVSDGTDDLLVGVASYAAEDCGGGEDHAPDGFTEVAAYTDWIDAHLADLEEPAFSDVRWGHPFIAEIWALHRDGIVDGFEDGAYHSTDPVTRQAMSAFLYRLAGEPAFSPPAEPSFGDVPLDHPFFAEVEWMADQGITTGYADGRYRPATPVSRGAMSAFLFRLAEPSGFTAPGTATFADVPTHHPFFQAVEWMAAEGITTGYADGRYRPITSVSRQSMAAFLYRLAPLL